MSQAIDEDPPDSTDLEGWRRAINEGRHAGYRLEAVVAAIQDLGPCTDKLVLNALAKHLSDALMGILRRYISVNHPNRGLDLIDKTHAQIIDAVLQPASADGKALRIAFAPRVTFRVKDALAAEERAALNRDKHETHLKDGKATRRGTDGKHRQVPAEGESAQLLNENLDVESILDRIPDPLKRLAFRLHMEGVPFKSKRSASIAKVLNIDEGTARQWVEEVQALLSSLPAVQELLQSKKRGSV